MQIHFFFRTCRSLKSIQVKFHLGSVDHMVSDLRLGFCVFDSISTDQACIIGSRDVLFKWYYFLCGRISMLNVQLEFLGRIYLSCDYRPLWEK